MQRPILIATCILSSLLWACFDDDDASKVPDAGAETGEDTSPKPDATDESGIPADIIFPTETFVVVENEPTEPTADVVDAHGELVDNAMLEWESADSSILHISSGGFALGEQPGTTELIATSGDILEHWPAEVVATLIAKVTVIPAEANLGVGATLMYDALIEDPAGFPIDDDRSVDWSTSDDDIATIDANGEVTGVAEGDVEIIASIDGVEGSAPLFVTDADVESLQITPLNPPAIPEAGQLQLQATPYDVEGNPLQGHSAQWTTSNPDVATVDDQGLVLGIAEGETSITASIDSVEDSLDIAVTFEMQSVASGDGFSCAIATNRLFCWGANDRGQLADGSFNDRDEAASADFPHTVDSIALGAGHGCLIDDQDQIWCWGDNEYGQLGQPPGDAIPSPELVDSDASFRQVAAGADHTCGLTDSDEVYCWGANDRYQSGHQAAHTHHPTLVESSVNFASITIGSTHSCAISDDATAYCWGDNTRQQLGGDTDATRTHSPVTIIGGNEFSTISAGADFTCGIAASGPPACWGANDRGQVGSGDTGDHGVPRSLALQPGQSLNAITSGDLHACGNVPSEGIHCWGAGDDGRLGTTDNEDATQPGPVDSDEEFVEISAGASHTCGRTQDHRMLCWGNAPAEGAELLEVSF